MVVEKWGKSMVPEKPPLKSGEVIHIPETTQVTESPAFVESLIVDNDRNSREELVSAVTMMMNRLDLPLSVLEELEDDEKSKDRVNVLASEYVGAVKTLDVEKQKQLVQALGKILG